MRSWTILAAMLALTACLRPQPAAPVAASLTGGALQVTLADGRTCGASVPEGLAFEIAFEACPGLTSARGTPAPAAGAPEILLAPMAELPLSGAGPAWRLWVWTAAGPYLFSR